MKHPPEIERARRLRQKQSVAENLLWQRLRRNQLNGWGFRRQAPLCGYVVDFLCHKPALIVEVEERPAPEEDDERRRYYRITPLGEAVARAEARRLAELVRLARASGFVPRRA